MNRIKLSNNTYDVLKEITTVWLPALGTLYFTLSGIWGLPFGEQIVGTITALVTFLGVALHISTKNYNEEKAMELSGLQTFFNADGIDMFDEVTTDEDKEEPTEE